MLSFSVIWWLLLWFLPSANFFHALGSSTRCESKPYNLKGQVCCVFYVCEIELSPFYIISIVGYFHLTGSYTSMTTCGTEEVSLSDNRTEEVVWWKVFQCIVLNWKKDESSSNYTSYIIPLQLIFMLLVHLHHSLIIRICCAKSVDLNVAVMNATTVCYWN